MSKNVSLSSTNLRTVTVGSSNLLGLLFVIAGCVSACDDSGRLGLESPSDAGSNDAGQPIDSGSPIDSGERPDAQLDSGVMDSGPLPDAGDRGDADVPNDAGPGPDAGPPLDAGPPPDAGPGPDAGPPLDAGPGPDAGMVVPWRVVHSRNQPGIKRLFGTASDDLWGTTGTAVWHWNGTKWFEINASMRVEDIWGMTASDLWAVGQDQIYHYDGASWSLVTPAAIIPAGAQLHTVWGATATDIYAVGQAGTGALILHYNGSVWVEDTNHTITEALNAVGVNAAGQVWVGGDEGVLQVRLGTTWVPYQHSFGTPNINWMTRLQTGELWGVGESGSVLINDGTEWQRRLGPNANWLHSIWGSAPNNVWIAGAGVLHKYDGTSWQAASRIGSRRFRSVFGFSASDVWAAGSGGLGNSLIHYDGVDWTEIIGSPARDTLKIVDGTAQDDVWAAGRGGVYHYDGTEWEDATGINVSAYAMFACARNEMWAVSGRGILHHAGGVFTSVIAPDVPNSQVSLTAIGGSSCTDVWALGIDSAASQTIVLHYQNGQWSRVRLFSIDSNTIPTSILAFGANDIWAIGNRSKMLHYDGTVWSQTSNIANLPQTGELWSASPTDAWLVGGDRFFRFDGQAWTQFNSVVFDPNLPSNPELKAVHGLAANDIWAVGGRSGTGLAVPRALHFDGTTWREQQIEAPEVPLGLWGDPSGFWAVGAEGMFIRTP